MAVLVLGTVVDSESGARLRLYVLPGIYASLFFTAAISSMAYGFIITRAFVTLVGAIIPWLVCILYFRSVWKDVRREVARAFGI